MNVKKNLVKLKKNSKVTLQRSEQNKNMLQKSLSVSL